MGLLGDKGFLDDRLMKYPEGAKPDWRQWLPVYGVYRLLRQGDKERPALVKRADSLSGIIFSLYHASYIVYGVYTSLESLGKYVSR